MRYFGSTDWVVGQCCGWHPVVVQVVVRVPGATNLERCRCCALNAGIGADVVAASLSKCTPMDWYFNGWGTEIESYFS